MSTEDCLANEVFNKYFYRDYDGMIKPHARYARKIKKIKEYLESADYIISVDRDDGHILEREIIFSIKNYGTSLIEIHPHHRTERVEITALLYYLNNKNYIG